MHRPPRAANGPTEQDSGEWRGTCDKGQDTEAARVRCAFLAADDTFQFRSTFAGNRFGEGERITRIVHSDIAITLTAARSDVRVP